LKELGMTNSIELGSGKVLAGLSKKIDAAAKQPFGVNSLEDLKALETALREGN
jgi:hypothetical protein